MGQLRDILRTRRRKGEHMYSFQAEFEPQIHSPIQHQDSFFEEDRCVLDVEESNAQAHSPICITCSVFGKRDRNVG